MRGSSDEQSHHYATTPRQSMMLTIDPPLLNSANVWATTKEELDAYYQCEHTGAVTIRTSLLDGFKHNDQIHQYCLFNANSGNLSWDGRPDGSNDAPQNMAASSLNSLGYSPIPLSAYIDIVRDIELDAQKDGGLHRKPVIFSVAGSVQEILQCHKLLRIKADLTCPAWMMEINLSCPNIPNKPPPAYSKPGLLSYLTALQNTDYKIPIGIKTPPYTYQDQFSNLISALLETANDGLRCPVSFITATNTLGNCLMFDSDSGDPAIRSSNGTGIGGLAGQASRVPSIMSHVSVLTMLGSTSPRFGQCENHSSYA